MNSPPVLSHVQVEPLLQAHHRGERAATISMDLGLTTAEVELQADRAILPDGQWLPWEEMEEIAREESACFVIKEDTAEKVQRFSDSLNRFYSLMPTGGAPTMLISGIPMHRIKGIDPYQDTLKKLHTIAPVTGRVMDTCTGLGYTAIEAAKTADEVVTIELDPMVLEVAQLNPWSRPLFESPNIRQIVGDAFDEVQEFEDETFSRIIHDPPMFSLAGDLYSGECYRHLHRVLKPKGRLYHYIGDPNSRSGRNLTKGVVRRLQEAGFSRVVRKPDAFGVVVYRT